MALALAGSCVENYPLLGTMTSEERSTIEHRLLTAEEKRSHWPNVTIGPRGVFNGRQFWQVAEALRAMREGRDPVPYLGRHAAVMDPNPESTEWQRPA